MKISFQRHAAKHILIIYISTYLISLFTLVRSIMVESLFLSLSIFTSQSEGGIAYRDGSIHQGDKLLEVNGVNLKKSSQEEACKALRVRKSRILGLKIFTGVLNAISKLMLATYRNPIHWLFTIHNTFPKILLSSKWNTTFWVSLSRKFPGAMEYLKMQS